MNIDEHNPFLSDEESINPEEAARIANQPEHPDGLLMDYEQVPLSGDAVHPSGLPAEKVGLVGGQPKDDESGLDISQYTGPHSKPSSAFHNPEAPFHTGPGNNEEKD